MTTTIPEIWEVDVILGQVQPPSEYVNFRYSNGSDYSGYMINGQRNGYGILRGRILSYIGLWEDDVLTQGVMIDTVRGTEFDIHPELFPQESSRAPDPQ